MRMPSTSPSVAAYRRASEQALAMPFDEGISAARIACNFLNPMSSRRSCSSGAG
jgi:hypothetical protein